MPIELTASTAPASASWRSPRRSRPSSPRARPSTTATGRYPFEAIDALRAAGYFAAPVPVELGGLGVASAHDLVVASSRLARGDASVAIGVNMHLVAVLNMERRRQVAAASAATPARAAFAASLEQIARDGVVLAAAISEPGQDLTRPATRATRTRVRLADRRAQDRSARCPRRRRTCTSPSPSTTATERSATRYAHGAHRRARRRGARRLGRARDACRPAATRSRSTASTCPRAACAAASRRATRVPYMERNLVGRAASTPRRRWASPRRRDAMALAVGAVGDRRARAMLVGRDRDRPRRRARRARARRRRSSTRTARPTLRATAAMASSAPCSPRHRRPRRSSTRRPRAWSTARSRCPAAPATATAARWRAPTATSGPGAFMHPLGANRSHMTTSPTWPWASRPPCIAAAGLPRRGRRVRDGRRVRHDGGGRRARRPDRQLARLRVARAAARLVLPVHAHRSRGRACGAPGGLG